LCKPLKRIISGTTTFLKTIQMLISQTIFAPLLLQKLSPHKVHKTIQEMDLNLPGDDNAISVYNIAEQLHVDADELMVHMNTLQSLHYISFSNRAHDAIFLTLSGRFTVVPFV
jgi:hypothetical protein